MSKKTNCVIVILTREMLDTFEKKIDPKHSAVLVVDVQNDFASKGGAFDKAGNDLSMAQKMIPHLIQFIDVARRAKTLVVHIRNIYNTDSNLFLSDSWLEQARRRRGGIYFEFPLCVEGSWGWEFHQGINTQKDEPIVTKHRFSAFINTDLDLILRSRDIRTLIMTGIATNVCVESTARDGFMKDYYIVYVKDCVATYSRREHEAALENIEKYFGQVVSSERIIELWKKHAIL